MRFNAMELETYNVEVLHFTNPYLIWVEVLDSGSDGSENVYFEQIGVYGVLPLETTLNPSEHTLTTKKSAKWMPAATVRMKKFFEDAVQITFCPIHIDYRSTIFDDNTHKYGEIVIKKPDGKYLLLSRQLVKSGYAIYDEDAFETELNSGNIKTKLSHSKIKEVIKQLERKCKAQIENQTRVFQTAQSIETALTEKNLKAHNLRTMAAKPEELDLLLQQKLNDLQMCKNVDEESVGRASKRNSDSSSLLQKKIRLLKGVKDASETAPGAASYFLRQRAEDLNALRKPKSQHTDLSKKFAFANDNNGNIDENRNESELSIVRTTSALEAVSSRQVYEKPTGTDNALKEDAVKNELDTTFEEDFSNRELMIQKKRKKKSPNKSPNKPPDYNVLTETRVVYGPPGTSLATLACKVIPRNKFVDKFDVPAIADVVAKTEKEDPLADEDSDVEVDTRLITEKLTCRLTGSEYANSETCKESIFENASLNDNVKNDSIQNPSDSKCTRSFSLLKQRLSFYKEAQAKLNSSATSHTSDKETTLKETSTENVSVNCNVKDVSTQKSNASNCSNSSSLLKRKLLIFKEARAKMNSSATSDTSTKDSSTSFEDDKVIPKVNLKKHHLSPKDDVNENISEVIERLNAQYKPIEITKKEEIDIPTTVPTTNHVNPFKNIDESISKFVKNIVTPVLMVHSKTNKRFQPTFQLRDVHFNTHIQIVLKNLSFDQPKIIQTVSWNSILRGYSTFIISPKNGGKTMGYLPAVCRLVADQDSRIDSVGPMSIIVCATSNSVSEVESFARIFLPSKYKVLAIYSGMNGMDIVTSLLNGCDILICTPPILYNWLQTDIGVDLRGLTSFVLDDCERLSEVFHNEIKFFLFKINEMLKSRVQKEVKVQYIVSSRVWCPFMEPLAKKAPNTVVCIGAFQECVLYSKTKTTVSFVTKENKVKNVLTFLEGVDISKRSVIICRADEEVEELEEALTQAKYVVFACNSKMTVQDLYNLRGAWDDYQVRILGPILVCLDDNLLHLNVTDAHYLVHYSLPSLFSEFCKRFAAVNDKYPSIFKTENESVQIKILLEDANVEQLPKILHFIKRCTSEVPTVLDECCDKILVQKDVSKSKKLVPLCYNMLTLGECPDFWNCQERHSVFKEADEPVNWMPKEGVVKFQILHFHTAVQYSAKLLSTTTKGETNKYSQNYKMLSLKISMHYGRESNKRLHGVPEVGDICAVSVRQNFFARCQVVKILNRYENGKPNHVLVNLLDEQKFERARDVDLYHLPEELAKIDTHVVHIRLANLQPTDKDVTYTESAKQDLKKISESDEDLYMRAPISFAIGNCLFVENVEVCRDLGIVKETVVLHDFKKILLEKYADTNEEHVPKLEKLCKRGGLEIAVKKTSTDTVPKIKNLPTPQWAHLEKDDFSAVLLASVEDPSSFFLRLGKFQQPCNNLFKDIQEYAAKNKEKISSVSEGDIVLATLPGEESFERARVDKILDDNKVKCFFVDHGDWHDRSLQDLIPINEKHITQLPFQAIECRLFGVKPPGSHWTEFASNWFSNCLEYVSGDLKPVYAKYFVKEKAQHTGGHKYGVALIDTNDEEDLVINKMILEKNLAEEIENEIGCLNELEFCKEPVDASKQLSENDEIDDSWEKVSVKLSKTSSVDDFVQPKVPLHQLFPEKPIRSVPLVDSDESDSEDRWQMNMTEDFMSIFKPAQKIKEVTPTVPAIKDADSSSSPKRSSKPINVEKVRVVESDTDSSVKVSSVSEVNISLPKVKRLDSDDLSSSESSLLAAYPAQIQTQLKEVSTTKKADKITVPTSDPLRKPKIQWYQTKKVVNMKILIIGAENYDLKVEDKNLKFNATANDVQYGFDLELYGGIDKKNASHSDKGQYIWVSLPKILEKTWLSLVRTDAVQKWIVYDVDALEVTSDEEEDLGASKEAIKHICNEGDNSDSEDEEFCDDTNFQYSR